MWHPAGSGRRGGRLATMLKWPSVVCAVVAAGAVAGAGAQQAPPDSPQALVARTCIGCHNMIGPERPASDLGPKRHSVEIDKLYKFAAVAGMGAVMGVNAKPIPWIRIHKLPELRSLRALAIARGWSLPAYRDKS